MMDYKELMAKVTSPEPQKIGQFYIQNDNIAPITTPEDIVILARRIINYVFPPNRFDGAKVRILLEEIGEHKDLDCAAGSAIRVSLNEVGKDYVDPGHHRDNLEISIPLARAFASGRINEDDDEAGLQFARERIRRFKHSMDYSVDNPRPRMRLSEHLQFLENLKKQKPELLEPVYKTRALPNEEKQRRYREDEQWLDDVIWPLRNYFQTQSSKYGLANRRWDDIHCLCTPIQDYVLGRKGGAGSLDLVDILPYLRRQKRRNAPGREFELEPLFIDDLEGNGS
ncbi:MAG: DUF3460 family protein [Planctomycetaceae bacterium]|nr:DUF3460 family protein [Planctomycetaceae bacterium]